MIVNPQNHTMCNTIHTESKKVTATISIDGVTMTFEQLRDKEHKTKLEKRLLLWLYRQKKETNDSPAIAG